MCIRDSSYGSVVDPQGGVRSNLVANLYGNIALLTFIGVNLSLIHISEPTRPY